MGQKKILDPDEGIVLVTANIIGISANLESLCKDNKITWLHTIWPTISRQQRQ